MDRVRVLCRVRPETAEEKRRGVCVVKIAGGMRVDLEGASEFIGEHEGRYTFDLRCSRVNSDFLLCFPFCRIFLLKLC